MSLIFTLFDDYYCSVNETYFYFDGPGNTGPDAKRQNKTVYNAGFCFAFIDFKYNYLRLIVS